MGPNQQHGLSPTQPTPRATVRSSPPSPLPGSQGSAGDSEGGSPALAQFRIVHVDPARYGSRGGQLCIDVTVYYRTESGIDSCEVTFGGGDVEVNAPEYEHPRTDEDRDRYWLIVEAAEVVRDGGTWEPDGGVWGTEFPLDAVNAEIVVAAGVL